MVLHGFRCRQLSSLASNFQPVKFIAFAHRVRAANHAKRCKTETRTAAGKSMAA